MPQLLKLSTMTEKRLKISRCGQFKSLWHSRLGQSFLLVHVRFFGYDFKNSSFTFPSFFNALDCKLRCKFMCIC
jgi:hypothetical protein